MIICDNLTRGQLANIYAQLRKRKEEFAYIGLSENDQPIIVTRVGSEFRKYSMEMLPNNEVKLQKCNLTFKR